MDDILDFGKSQEQHNMRLDSVMKRLPHQVSPLTVANLSSARIS